MEEKRKSDIARMLTIIAAIVIIVYGILGLINETVGGVLGVEIIPSLDSLLAGIISIGIGLLVFLVTGLVKRGEKNLAFNPITLALLAILAIIFGHITGGVILIIAAMILLL